MMMLSSKIRLVANPKLRSDLSTIQFAVTFTDVS